MDTYQSPSVSNFPTNQNFQKRGNKAFLIICAIIFLLVLVYVVFAMFINKKGPENTVGNDNFKILALDEKVIPQGIPKDFPFEENAQVVQNYTTDIIDGSKFQSTRSFISSKTPEENFSLYKKYFLDKGFNITGESDNPDIKSIFAASDAGEFSVMVSRNVITSEVVVTINYVFDGKKAGSFEALKEQQ